MKKQDFLLVVLIWIVTLALFFPVLTTYFMGDDFFHFRLSDTDGSFLGFVKLFGFYPISEHGAAFYRPIFREVVYNLSYQFWGLNQLPLRILSLILHFGNIVLIYLLITKLFIDLAESTRRKIVFFTTLLFAIAPANVGILYYLAGGIQAQGATLFILLSMFLFSKHYKLAFLSFILSLMSHEIALSAPLIVAVFSFMTHSFNSKKLAPFFLGALLLLVLEVKLIGFSVSEVQYQPVRSEEHTSELQSR